MEGQQWSISENELEILKVNLLCDREHMRESFPDPKLINRKWTLYHIHNIHIFC